MHPLPEGVAALIPVSEDKIQITLLILGRGALSTYDMTVKHWTAFKMHAMSFFIISNSQLLPSPHDFKFSYVFKGITPFVIGK